MDMEIVKKVLNCDLDEDAAITAVAATLGALPPREEAFNPRTENRTRSFTANRGQRVLTHEGEPDQALLRWYWPTTDDSDLAEMDALWNRAKAEDKAKAGTKRPTGTPG